MDKQQQIIYHIQKTQWIRIIDFTILGPGLIWTGITQKKLDSFTRFVLAITGGLTFGYNLYNFLAQKKFLEKYNGEIVE